MKYADKLGARYTVVVGDNELAEGKARMKDMETGETEEVLLDDSLYTTLYNKFAIMYILNICNNYVQF